MARTQTQVLPTQEGSVINHTFSSDAFAGDVVEVGTIPMIVQRDVDVSENTLGALITDKVHKVPQKAEAITKGDAVYWDDAGDPVTGTAGTGACTATASGNVLMGVCVETTVNTDTYCKVLLTAAQRTTTIAGSVLADDITGSDSTLNIAGLAGDAGDGGVVSQTGGAGDGANDGGTSSLVGGASGAGATGDGANAIVTGGDALSTNGEGGSIVNTPGSGAGTGEDGIIQNLGLSTVQQGAPTAETTDATLTIAELLTKIVTGTHAAGATQTYTLPTGTLMSGGVAMSIGDSFDWSVINLSAAALDTVTIAAGTDHTIVGNPIVQSAHASTGGIYGNSATFRSRMTGATTWITYRVA